MSVKNSEAKVDGRFNDTRQRILQRAREIYHQRGYAGISLQELADSVGITKAALFHHFKSKQELFFEVLLATCRNYQRIIQEAISSAPDTRTRLRNLLDELSQHAFFDPMKFMSDEYHQLNLEQQQEINQAFANAMGMPIQQILDEAMQKGELRIHDSQLAASIFLNMAMLLPSPGNPVVPSLPEPIRQSYIEEMLNIFWGGIAKDR